MKLTDIAPYSGLGDPIKHTYLEFVGKNAENVSGQSNKFWEAAIFKKDDYDYVFVRRWGKYGAKGQIKEQNYQRLRHAKTQLRKVRNSKWDKGYTKEVDVITRLGTLVAEDA